jgi:ABC-type transport system involved in multi-copper enzyme maturation permease subunit
MNAPVPRRPAPPPRPLWGKAALLLLPTLVGTGGLLVFADELPPWSRLLLWGTVLAIPAAVLAVAWCRLLGPVLPCELLRCGRSERYVFFRCLYACVLLGVLGWAYLSWFTARGFKPAALLWDQGTLPAEDLPRFASQFFIAFLGAQLVVVLLLTPVYVAGAIAEEREKRTLEFLLATDLGPTEIVVSKLSARLLNLALLLLTGLPVLALTQLWGGVDPVRVAAGFAATGLTMLSVGSLSLFNSAAARRPIDALLVTYGQVALCLIVCCLPGLNLGHPLGLLAVLAGADDPSMLLLVVGYALVHVLTTYVLVNMAATRLRLAPLAPVSAAEPEPVMSVARAESPPAGAPSMAGVAPWVGPVAPGESPPARSARRLPPVGDEAVLWKELHVEPHWSWEKAHPLTALLFLFVAVCVGSLGLTLVLVALTDQTGPGPLNLWVRWVGTIVGGLLVFATGFYAAGTVSRERERQTLDSLLTLPDGRTAVLAAKWRGGFLSTRGAWWCLGVTWGLGVLTGSLNVVMVPLLVVGFGIYLAFVASLGVFCSAVCRSTLRATLATVITLLGVSGGAWLAGWGGNVLRTGPLAEQVAGLQTLLQYGLTLPVPLWSLAIRYDEPGMAGDETAWRAAAGVLGLWVYALAAWVLWRLALARFAAEAGPAPRRRQA